MPTYDYQCTECGSTFELFQSMSDKPKKRVKPDEKNCSCDAPVVRLLGTGGGVIFKGSGFYETDYRSKSYTDAAKADKASSTKKKSESSSSGSEKKAKESKSSKKSDSTAAA